jgi:hypothetical protein
MSHDRRYPMAASSPPERAPKRNRTLRMSDRVYEAALAISRLRQESLAVVAERLLEEMYVERHRELLAAHEAGQTREVTAA